MKCKRILSLALAVCMAFGSAAALPEGVFETGSTITASAEEIKSSGWIYFDNEDGTIELRGYSGNKTHLKIPSQIDGKKVISIGTNAFRSDSNIESVDIPEGVTIIDSDAFFCCYNLKSVQIPNSLRCIGACAFEYCESLEKINIPDGVTEISDYAFCGCTSITSVTIPSGIMYICNNVFSGCSSLTSITIPGNVYSIFPEAFCGCSSLKSVTIKKGVESIYNSAFSYCSSLTSVTIPDSVTSIDDGAFFGCESLKSVTIPGSISIISNAFSGCAGLTSVTIKKGVETIGVSAFNGCENLTSITIPNSVTRIEESAFENCTSLTSISIPDSVTCIDNRAFFECIKLASIIIPNSVTSIGDQAFYGCESLKSVTIPSSVTSIGNCAFEFCRNLTSIIIPNSVIDIGADAFSSCTSLKSVTIPNSITFIGNGTFDGCTNLSSVTIPKSVTCIDYYAFRGCGLNDVYYIGTKKQWDSIGIAYGNDELLNAKKQYKNDGYSGFKIGRDNNGYYHSRNAKIKKAGFVGRTDHMFTSADYYNELTKDSSGFEKLNILNRMSENWEGSCYGVALSIGLVNSKLVSISDISDKKPSTYYKLNPRQTKDKKFSNMIEYYYLSQFLEKGGSSAIIGQTFSNGLTNWLNGYDKLDSLLKKTVTIAKKNKPFLLSYGYNSSGEPVGHTVVALGCEKVGDKYNIIVYDENYRPDESVEVNYEYLSINDDYSGFSFSNGVNNSNFNYIQIADLNKMKGTPVLSSNVKNLGKSNINSTINGESVSTNDSSETDDTSVIISFDMGSAFCISDSKGHKLEYNKGNFSGNMKVYSVNAFLTNENPTYSVAIPKDLKYIIENKNSNLDFEIMYGEHYYALASCKSPKIVINTDKRISIQGDNIDFTAKIGVKDGTTSTLLSVSGNSKNSVDIDISNMQPSFSTDKTIDSLSVSSITPTKKTTKNVGKITKGFVAITEKDTIKIVQHAAHSWSAWKTTGFDFAKNTSSQTRKCSVCGKTSTQTVKNAITRLAGANRYETASVISTKMFKTAKTVIIATGMTFHDAMVAVPLANAYNAPLLLATEKHITAQTEAELKRLGAKNVIVVSTNGAIGDKAKAEFKAKKLNMTYIEGKTCFETAAKVAKALQTKTKTAPDTIFFATDSAFADALSASPVAAIKNAPIMYLNNKSIDKATADYLKSVKGKVKNAYIIGGDGVISNAMMKNVATALGLKINKTVVRVAGKNRYETCVAVNNKFKSVLSSDGICVAKGLDFPDALAGGVYAAATRQALFLADGKKLLDCQNSYLKSKNAGKITVFGGTGAVSDELVKLIAKASV